MNPDIVQFLSDLERDVQRMIVNCEGEICVATEEARAIRTIIADRCRHTLELLQEDEAEIIAYSRMMRLGAHLLSMTNSQIIHLALRQFWARRLIFRAIREWNEEIRD